VRAGIWKVKKGLAEKRVQKAVRYLESENLAAKTPVEVVPPEKTVAAIYNGMMNEAYLPKGAPPGSAAAKRHDRLLREAQSMQAHFWENQWTHPASGGSYNFKTRQITIPLAWTKGEGLTSWVGHEFRHARDEAAAGFEGQKTHLALEEATKSGSRKLAAKRTEKLDRIQRRYETPAYETQGYVSGKRGESSAELQLGSLARDQQRAHRPKAIGKASIRGYLRGARERLTQSTRYWQLSDESRKLVDARLNAYFKGYEIRLFIRFPSS
jgi:hypothetical protein